MNDYERENFERIEVADDYDDVYPFSWFSLFGLPAAGWMGVIFFYPLVWAIGTGFAIAMILGYGTARGILKIRSIKRAVALSPICGGLWILFFYVLFAIFES